MSKEKRRVHNTGVLNLTDPELRWVMAKAKEAYLDSLSVNGVDFENLMKKCDRALSVVGTPVKNYKKYRGGEIKDPIGKRNRQDVEDIVFNNRRGNPRFKPTLRFWEEMNGELVDILEGELQRLDSGQSFSKSLIMNFTDVRLKFAEGKDDYFYWFEKSKRKYNGNSRKAVSKVLRVFKKPRC